MDEKDWNRSVVSEIRMATALIICLMVLFYLSSNIEDDYTRHGVAPVMAGLGLFIGCTGIFSVVYHDYKRYKEQLEKEGSA
jgi:hypothetical protein